MRQWPIRKATPIEATLAFEFTQRIYADIRRLCIEANKQDKNLAVGPLHSCEERPTIEGHYHKYKFDYAFLPYGAPPPAQWLLFDVAYGLPIEFGTIGT